MKSTVEEILAQKRLEERRKWFAWILVPAFASAAGILFFKQSQKPNEGFLAEQDLLIELDGAGDVEVVADLDLLEDLETLEDWDGHEEA